VERPYPMIRQLPGWFFALLDQGLASSAMFALSLVIARSAGAESLAQFSLACAAALFCGSLHQAMISAPLISLVPGMPPAQREAHLAAVAGWHRIGGFLALPLIALVMLLAAIPASDPPFLIPVLAGLAIVVAAGRAGIEFRRRVAYLQAVPVRAVAASAWAHAPALALAAVAGLGVSCGSWLALLALASGALVGCWLLPAPAGTSARGGACARAHWQLGRWHLASLLVLWATNHAFGWYLAGHGEVREAGYLHAARTLLGLPLAALLAFDSWFQPRGREAWLAGGTAGLARVGLHHLGLAAAVALPCFALMWWESERLTVWVFGSELAPASAAVALTAWCALLAIPDRLLGLAISARQRPQATVAGFVVCLGLTAWLLPLWAADGAVGCARLLAVNAAAMVLVPGVWLLATWRKA
jgi:hypothetical protein